MLSGILFGPIVALPLNVAAAISNVVHGLTPSAPKSEQPRAVSDAVRPAAFAREMTSAGQALASTESERSSSSSAPRQTAVAVKPNHTQLSGQQAGQAITHAFTELTGKAPSEKTLAILTSHWSLETGQGKSMYNYNFAGIKGRGPEGYTAVMSTREGWGATARKINDGFRAYTSATDGAKDYVSLLLRKYAPAVEAAQAGDPAAFASRLKDGGYYTGNEQAYAKGITHLANRAMAYGLDALGATAGPLATLPTPANGTFETSVWSSARSSHSGWSPSTLAAFTEPPSVGGSSLSSAMADEIVRAALQIARERGVGGGGEV